MKEISMMGYIEICQKCGRKFLIEHGLIGVSHIASTFVTCLDCFTPEQREKVKKLYKIDIDG
jgi:hypothetical protein